MYVQSRALEKKDLEKAENLLPLLSFLSIVPEGTKYTLNTTESSQRYKTNLQRKYGSSNTQLNIFRVLPLTFLIQKSYILQNTYN